MCWLFLLFIENNATHLFTFFPPKSAIIEVDFLDQRYATRYSENAFKIFSVEKYCTNQYSYFPCSEIHDTYAFSSSCSNIYWVGDLLLLASPGHFLLISLLPVMVPNLLGRFRVIMWPRSGLITILFEMGVCPSRAHQSSSLGFIYKQRRRDFHLPVLVRWEDMNWGLSMAIFPI